MIILKAKQLRQISAEAEKPGSTIEYKLLSGINTLLREAAEQGLRKQKIKIETVNEKIMINIVNTLKSNDFKVDYYFNEKSIVVDWS